MDREAVPIFDSFDFDLVVKVFSNTLFSPIFAFFIPLFYRAQGAPWNSPIVVDTALYFVFVSIFWAVKATSVAWRNGVNPLAPPRRVDWGEQVIVITGGASGVGALLAETFAVRNVTVAVLDIKPIETENFNITYYKCDVSNPQEVEEAAKKIVEELGHPTVLVNNAGVVQGKTILDLTPEDVKQTMGVNVLSHFWTLKAFLPHMIQENAGHIITVGSVMGYLGVPQMADYAASKAALLTLHESLRYELDTRYNAPQVKTTLVVPGHMMTPLFSRMSVPTTAFGRFFFPSIAPHTVAKAVIAAVDEVQSTTICLPFYAHAMPYLGLLPSWLRDSAQWLAGANDSMRGFTKVSGLREDEPQPEKQ